MGAAATVPKMEPLESWSAEKVLAFVVDSMGTDFEEYREIFISNDVDGYFLAKLSEFELDDTLAELGITNSYHALKLHKMYASLKYSSYSSANVGSPRITPVVLEPIVGEEIVPGASKFNNIPKISNDAQGKHSIIISAVNDRLQEGSICKRQLELANSLREKHGYNVLVLEKKLSKRKEISMYDEELKECMTTKIHTVIICVSRLYYERYDKLLEAHLALSLQEKGDIDVLYVLMEENCVADDDLPSKLPKSLPEHIIDDVINGAKELIKRLALNVSHPLWEDDHITSTAAALANLIGDKGKLATDPTLDRSADEMGGNDADIIQPFDEMEVKADMRLNPFDAQDPPYPMFVMRCKDLVEHDLSELPPHEKALEMGLLWEVVQKTPGQYHLFKSLPNGDRGEQLKSLNCYEAVLHRARFLAVSHQWLRPQLGHPDSSDHRKLTALKTHFNSAAGHDNLEDYLWMDYFSIPQDLNRRDKQILGIKSLPCYFMYASTILIVCESWDHLTDKTNGYLSRGHCLMEMCTSKLPRIDIYGKWYIPGSDSSGAWGSCQSLSLDGIIKPVSWNDFVDAGSPLCGNYTKEEDRLVYLPIMKKYCDAFDSFNNLFLQRVRSCTTWRQTGMLASTKQQSGLGACLQRLDGGMTGNQVMSPSEWADSVLPPGYIDALRASLADVSHCPKCDSLRVP